MYIFIYIYSRIDNDIGFRYEFHVLDNAFLVLSILNNSLASVLHWPFSKTSEM